MEAGLILLIKKIGSLFITKKRVIGWISAVALAAGAVATGMQSQEFKDAVCSATVLTPVESK